MRKIIHIFTLCLVITALIPLLSCQKQDETAADLVLLNGKVITVDSDFSIREAVAVKDNQILAVGTTSEIKKLIKPDTQVIDLNQNTVLPGLIDAHAHMNSLGDEITDFNIRNCRSFEDVVDRVRREVQKKRKGEWIIGGRWDHTKWETKNFPVHDALSAVSPHNPVYLTRVDGNSALVNQKALEQAGIDKNTPNPEGGVILKKRSGEPAGVLLNRAMNLVKTHFPPETDQSWKEKIILAVDDCVKKGLTGWHEAGV
ncbi:MAG: amidohydrolase, partial [Candidatus Aminicenantaceae bacterium]